MVFDKLECDLVDGRIIDSLGERKLIHDIVRKHLHVPESMQTLDDAAVFRLADNLSLLVTTDSGPRRSFIQQFGLGSHADLGDYCATMSISDIAAMGGNPLLVVAACLLPTSLELASFDQLVAGISEACKSHGAQYVGGDTKESSELRVVTTAIGVAHPGQILTRAGAQPGDIVWVSGKIGRTLAHYVDSMQKGSTLTFRPRARVHLGKTLAENKLPTSCIDMSDGPIAAAREIAEVGGLCLTVDTDQLPLAFPKKTASPHDWVSLILNVGGDYELMFTASADKDAELKRLGCTPCGLVEQIGNGNLKPGVKLTGGNIPDVIEPWEHFRTTHRIASLFEKLMR